MSQLWKVRTQKLLTVGSNSRSLKATGRGKAKSNVSEVSESENSKHVQGNWTLVSAPQPSSSSRMNVMRTVECADERLSTFSLEDSAKRQKTVSWGESGPEFCEQADTQELMIDSEWFGHVSPPWFAPQFPVVSASNVEAAAANDVALQHYGQKVVYLHVTTTSGRGVLIQITCGVMNAQTIAQHICTETSVSRHHLRPHQCSHRESEFGVERLSFLFENHVGEWSSTSQSDGDDWRKRVDGCGRRSLHCWW